MDTMVLLGAEEVGNAARSIAESAQQMRQMPGSLQATLYQHQQWMDDWLARFEEVLREGVVRNE